MPTDSPYPLVDVAAVLISNPERDRLLLDYNARWGTFSFPMTKIEDVPGPTPGSPPVPETPADAALRAAAEVLGYPLPPRGRPARLNYPVEPYHRSGGDGVWKRYNYVLFKMTAADAPQPLPGHVAVWLSPADLKTHAPVSPTVGLILGAVPAGEWM